MIYDSISEFQAIVIHQLTCLSSRGYRVIRCTSEQGQTRASDWAQGSPTGNEQVAGEIEPPDRRVCIPYVGQESLQIGIRLAQRLQQLASLMLIDAVCLHQFRQQHLPRPKF